ncbi:ROK family protein [Oscillatoria sp. FACHB-1406]|uniref:ROK family protein n=1 Tax=Oscillatoria sp. FACHB-1406 TaxID=2692846 RepID=UPI0016836456|nr:ROK family protein [Oscillatoria sp. FACHB-1406]MBD2579662.1 ROK family protein [Oscillatoria sp. FACHB-1406]
MHVCTPSTTQRRSDRRAATREPLILVFDFGGTKHAAALLKPGQRHWQEYRRVLAPPGADAKTDLEIARSLGRELLQGRTPLAIGVSFGGPVNAATGEVRLSHHVPGWENIPLSRILEDEFGAPAAVDNDANVAALGEYRFGAGRGYNSLFYITVSTGVGGGWILNGKLWQGTEGMAGEIGHTVVEPNGPQCLCGKRGCVERLASGPYMAGDVRSQLLEQPERGEVLRTLVGGKLDAITGQTVSLAAEAGDEVARAAIAKAGWALGTGIGNVANLINPQLFVLGGGVTKAGEQFWQVVRQTAETTALPEVHFQVIPAELGDEAPLWGAVALAEDLLALSYASAS